MGEGADRLSARIEETSGDVRKVDGELDRLRGELGTLVAELDRRRHEAFDIGLQVRRHPTVVAVAAAAAALVVGGLVAIAVRSRRRARRPSVRARETRRALGRLLDHPDRVAAEPNLGAKVLAAKRMVDRWVLPPQRTSPR
jgi:hypothetical protein